MIPSALLLAKHTDIAHEVCERLADHVGLASSDIEIKKDCGVTIRGLVRHWRQRTSALIDHGFVFDANLTASPLLVSRGRDA